MTDLHANDTKYGIFHVLVYGLFLTNFLFWV